MLRLLLIFTVFFYSAMDALACRQSALSRSKSLFDAVLVDVTKTYHITGGGGISALSLIATDVIKVSISQEERVDEITYTLTTRPNCEVVILKKRESTRTMGLAK